MANNLFSRFVRAEDGTATLEMSLVAFLLFVTTFSVAEFAVLWWEMNSADKATQVGVREAVVSDPIATELASWDCGTSSILPGTPCSASGTATFGTITCDGSTQSCSSGYTFNGTEFNRLLARMQQVFPLLTGAEVSIDYTDIGLGFAGRVRPVPLVSVRLVGMTFDFLAIEFMMGRSVAMPNFRATLTGEDLTTAGTS